MGAKNVCRFVLELCHLLLQLCAQEAVHKTKVVDHLAGSGIQCQVFVAALDLVELGPFALDQQESSKLATVRRQ